MTTAPITTSGGPASPDSASTSRVCASCGASCCSSSPRGCAARSAGWCRGTAGGGAAGLPDVEEDARAAPRHRRRGVVLDEDAQIVQLVGALHLFRALPVARRSGSVEELVVPRGCLVVDALGAGRRQIV